MAITVTLSANSPYSIVDIASTVDFISTEASVTLDSSTQFTGTGLYNGQLSTYVATGSGFATSTLGGETYISAGVVDEIAFTTPLGNITFENIDIDMAIFSPIVISDLMNVAPFAIEEFMMAKPWDITLGNQNDIAPNTTLVGDGAALNTTGNDIIRGKGGNDTLFSGDGRDKLFGNIGNDILSGGKGGDRIDGGQGRDKLFGGLGKDTLIGGEGLDKLLGGQGVDKLLGGKGRDVLDGGADNDVLIGGSGFDRFVFRDGSGTDKVRSFDLDDREDIDLSLVTEIKSYADLLANHIDNDGNNVVIDDGAGTVIILTGLQKSDLSEGDFLF